MILASSTSSNVSLFFVTHFLIVFTRLCCCNKLVGCCTCHITGPVMQSRTFISVPGLFTLMVVASHHNSSSSTESSFDGIILGCLGVKEFCVQDDSHTRERAYGGNDHSRDGPSGINGELSLFQQEGCDPQITFGAKE
mmetsp:Transcript_21057/g.35913  ORF Transcript_21057/g.35913 Transcript_21057/m.35913 type:complete len:138 (-) Transcript_21057:454-867(-)